MITLTADLQNTIKFHIDSMDRAFDNARGYQRLRALNPAHVEECRKLAQTVATNPELRKFVGDDWAPAEGEGVVEQARSLLNMLKPALA